jgi:hypothetical protein
MGKECREHDSAVGYCGSPWPLPNVLLGVSVEDQATADIGRSPEEDRTAKAKLIKQAAKQGISENFGLKEEREISSMAQSIIHDGSRFSAERNQASKLDIDFYDWVTTYTP